MVGVVAVVDSPANAIEGAELNDAVSAALRGDRGATVEYSTLAPLESHVRAYVEPIRLSAPGPMPFRAMLVLSDDTNSKRAERMRADFLANASHELRTPLASLAGFIETLSGPARALTHLGTKPLGAVLFNHPGVRRGPISVCLIERGIWGRQSVFFLYNKPLLVSEYFLEDCPMYQLDTQLLDNHLRDGTKA